MKRTARTVYMASVSAFLYLPIAVQIVYSFNDTR